MHRIPTPLLAVLLLGGPAVLPAADDGIAVRPAGLRVVAPGYHTEADDLRPFNHFAGTVVVLRVEREGGGLIGLDSSASELGSWEDDRGTDLLADPPAGQRFASDASFGTFPKVSSDGAVALIEVESPHRPGADAKTMRLRGNLAVTVGDGVREVSVEDVAMEKGAEATIAGVAYTLESVGEPGWGDHALDVALVVEGPDTSIKTVRAFDADGNDLTAGWKANGSTSMNGRVTRTGRKLQLSEAAETVTLRAEVWKDVAVREVPVDLAVGIALDGE